MIGSLSRRGILCRHEAIQLSESQRVSLRVSLRYGRGRVREVNPAANVNRRHAIKEIRSGVYQILRLVDHGAHLEDRTSCHVSVDRVHGRDIGKIGERFRACNPVFDAETEVPRLFRYHIGPDGHDHDGAVGQRGGELLVDDGLGY